MFRFEPTVHTLPVAPEAIVYLAESSNQPHVAVPGRKAQAAQATVVGLREGTDACSVYISLWLLADCELAVWVHETTVLPLTRLEEVAEEAWLFCESMGFIMDVVPFDTLPPAEREAILDRILRAEEAPEVVLPQPAPAAALATEVESEPAPFSPSPSDLARLGRLLSSF